MNLNHFFKLYSEGDFDVEFNIEDVFDAQLGVDNVDGPVNDDSGNGYDNYNKDSFDDSDYNLEDSNIIYDVNVGMSEFHSVMDVDEHGILINHATNTRDNIVDEELEVIDIDVYMFVGIHEY